MNTFIALIIFVLMACLSGAALAFLSKSKRLQLSKSSDNEKSEDSLLDSSEDLVERVNTLLPQTQCAQCGHPGCRPYATAIIENDAPINQCPPGGDALIQELATLLGKDVISLDTTNGEHKPEQVALIIEPDCIGCTLCIAACPVDAIVGASKYMHTVIADQCTGCELCIPPCPVDCIELIPAAKTLSDWQAPKPQ